MNSYTLEVFDFVALASPYKLASLYALRKFSTPAVNLFCFMVLLGELSKFCCGWI